MAKQHLLIVDSDPKSLRVLEVSLKKAGFSITRASNGLDAIEKIQISIPDMIITETTMPEMGGFELIERLKENPEWQDIPVMFLTAQKSIEDKIRGLEQGVEDYLTKPIFIREILARVSLVMQRRQRERLETRGSKTEFAGNLSDMGIIDLIQTIDISQKSGVIHVQRDGDRGEIFFKNGKVIDAETSSRKGEEAVYRMLVWSNGHFHIEFNNLDRPDKITLSTQGLLMEGMRRLDEWGRLQEQLPSLNSVFDIDDELLAERLGEIPDEINALLKHFDGRRSLMEVVNLCPLGDLEALTIITKLYFEGLICDLGTTPETPTGAPDSPTTDIDEGTPVDTVSEQSLSADPIAPSTAPSVTQDTIPVESEGLSQRPVHSQTKRIVAPVNPPSEAPPPLRQSLQGNFVNVITKSSTPAAPAADMPTTGTGKRPDTGEYKLSRHLPPTEEISDDEENTSPGIPSAGLSAVASEQQTMMMHVSKTPTNPPPAVGRVSVESPNPMSPPMADDREEIAPGTDKLISPTAVNDERQTLGGGIAGPAELEQMALNAENVQTDPIEQPYDAAQTDAADADDSNEPSDLPRETANLPGQGAVDTTVPSDIITGDEEAERSAPLDSDERESVEDLPADEKSVAEKPLESIPDDQNEPESDADTDSEEDADKNADEQEPAETTESFDDEEEEFEEDDDDTWASVDERSTRSTIVKVVVGAAAVLLLGGGAAMYFGTDLFRAPPQKTTSTEHTKKESDAQSDSSVKSDTPSGDETTDDLASTESDTDVLAAKKDLGDTEAAGDPLETPVGEDAVPAADTSGDQVLSNTPTAEIPAVSSDLDTLTRYHELVEKAEKQPRKKKLETLEEAIALNPNGVEALTEFAIATMETKKYQDQALGYAERVTLLDPKNAKAWLAIGYIYQLKNETEKSTAAYQKCAQCDGPKEFVRNCKLLAR
ncbi:MAG: DUF4388 domain-containing protein [Deltaproteobacteria bacterium]|nr:DUF4388 domain-containing protein [Deltaproteobacteria bacterium]